MLNPIFLTYYAEYCLHNNSSVEISYFALILPHSRVTNQILYVIANDVKDLILITKIASSLSLQRHENVIILFAHLLVEVSPGRDEPHLP